MGERQGERPLRCPGFKSMEKTRLAAHSRASEDLGRKSLESPAGAGLVPLPLRRPHGAPALASKVWVGGTDWGEGLRGRSARSAPPRPDASSGWNEGNPRAEGSGGLHPSRAAQSHSWDARWRPRSHRPASEGGRVAAALWALGQPQFGQPLLAYSTSLDKTVSPERGSEVENRGCEGHLHARRFLRSEFMSLPSVRGATP